TRSPTAPVGPGFQSAAFKCDTTGSCCTSLAWCAGFKAVASWFLSSHSADMKPAVDEMFPEGAGPYVDLDEAGGSTGLLMDLAANEKAVHSDFFNDFEDLFDDDDIQ
ncbi:hypothetical protein PDJAM_G00135820, partial [Pangasius djambal]|nr:hypothetical protein [Pangasius djambal]